MVRQTSILVIDDQIGVEGSLHQRSFLRAYEGLPYKFHFESCASAGGHDSKCAVKALSTTLDVDLVLLDIKFGGEDDRLGFEILSSLTSRFPFVPVLMLSSMDRDILSLGRCLENGSVGFLAKQQTPPEFESAIEKALALSRSHVIHGQSPALRALRRQIARLSPYDRIPVMIVGERGTGKELVARYIHLNGTRRRGPFIAVNCAGLTDSLLEAELFGAERGAYTGATSTRLGYLERADGGILFLDEVGNMPVATQARLLRALEERSFRRVGVTDLEILADFQIICATNVDPVELIQAGKLKEDFFDRVAAVTLRTPTLRECREDIAELCKHFLRELELSDRKKFSDEAMIALGRYEWPGNMRELRRAVQEAVVSSEMSSTIELHHLPRKLVESDTSDPSPRIESQYLASDVLPGDPAKWPRERLLNELRLAIEAKRRIVGYKGNRWKAEFMRLMYPKCKASSAKGFGDLVRRLSEGPWGVSDLSDDDEIRRHFDELTR